MKNLIKLLMAGTLLLTSISIFAADSSAKKAVGPVKDTTVTTDCAAINGDRAIKAPIVAPKEGEATEETTINQ